MKILAHSFRIGSCLNYIAKFFISKNGETNNAVSLKKIFL